jgi:signal transduction histidine kinase
MGADIEPRMLRALAAVLFGVVFGVLYAVSDPAQAGALLFVIPVALLALSDGLRGGVAGSVVAAVLLVIWVTTDEIDLNILGWASRLASFSTIGLLVGRYEDLARAYERQRLDEQYASELHDHVVQSLVVARYHLDEHPEAQQAVDKALEGAKHIISSRLGDLRPGDLRMTRPHEAVPPPPRRDR